MTPDGNFVRGHAADHLVTDTLRRVPEPRGISDKDARDILDALAAEDEAHVKVEKAVAKALKNGASAQEATGLSPNTIYKYGRAWGWPTKENRADFNASKYPKRPGRQR